MSIKVGQPPVVMPNAPVSLDATPAGGKATEATIEARVEAALTLPNPETRKLSTVPADPTLKERGTVLAPQGTPRIPQLTVGLKALVGHANGPAEQLSLPDILAAMRNFPAGSFTPSTNPHVPGATALAKDPYGLTAGLTWTAVDYAVDGLNLRVIYEDGNASIPRYIAAPTANGAELVLKLINWDTTEPGQMKRGSVHGAMIVTKAGAILDMKADGTNVSLRNLTFFSDGAIAHGASMYQHRYDANHLPTIKPHDMAKWLGGGDLVMQVSRHGKSEAWTFDKTTTNPVGHFQIPDKL